MTSIRFKLNINKEQVIQLRSLQKTFSEICNEISSIACQQSCWSRVPLHHLSYHKMRDKYPLFGSQMVCNAIYAVTRTYKRLVELGLFRVNEGEELGPGFKPRIIFLPIAPVYFDMHTLSIKGGVISMYTLNGRMRFSLNISEKNLQSIMQKNKVKEIMMVGHSGGFDLLFNFEKESSGSKEVFPVTEYIQINDSSYQRVA